jgi:hypothetical protein
MWARKQTVNIELLALEALLEQGHENTIKGWLLEDRA